MREYATLYDPFKAQNMVIYRDSPQSGWVVHGYVQNTLDASILAEGLNKRAVSGE